MTLARILEITGAVLELNGWMNVAQKAGYSVRMRGWTVERNDMVQNADGHGDTPEAAITELIDKLEGSVLRNPRCKEFRQVDCPSIITY